MSPSTPHDIDERADMEVRFPSHARYLHMIHELTRHFSRASGFTDGEAEQIALAVDEATTNVIQHAYGDDPNREIEVHFASRDESLEIIIVHDGEGIYPIPVPELDLDRLVAEHKTGGLGLTIMSQMMDRVEHSKAQSGKARCVLVRYKNRQPPE
jgi:serine/threonine-protein kinase RsbW